MFSSLGGFQHYLLGCSVLGQQAEDTRLNKLIRGAGSVLGVAEEGDDAEEAPWYQGQRLLQPENHTEVLSCGLRAARSSAEGHGRSVLPEAIRLPPPFSCKLIKHLQKICLLLLLNINVGQYSWPFLTALFPR